jgi:hypothetical protein
MNYELPQQDDERARQPEKKLRDYLQHYQELLLDLKDTIATYIKAAKETKNKGGQPES